MINHKHVDLDFRDASSDYIVLGCKRGQVIGCHVFCKQANDDEVLKGIQYSCFKMLYDFVQQFYVNEIIKAVFPTHPHLWHMFARYV